MNQLDLLDEILLLSEGGKRSLDCILVFEFKKDLNLEDLKSGALRAQKIFPKTSSHEVAISSDENLEQFIERPLKDYWHLEQHFTGRTLAFKMSHVLGDAVSMLMWIKAQMGEEVSTEKIKLHEFPPKKNTPYKSLRNSSKWPRSDTTSQKRSFSSIKLKHKGSYPDVSINDLVTLALLKTLPVERKSLWIPVNVRKNPWEGFGNGLSRLRIYPSHLETRQELQSIRKQKREAWKNGELFLPSPDMSLDSSFVKTLLKLWVNRPWADWGSLSLSHVHDKENYIRDVRSVWGVTNIPDKLNAGVFAYTIGDETTFTITYDSTVNRKEIETFLGDFLKKFKEVSA